MSLYEKIAEAKDLAAEDQVSVCVVASDDCGYPTRYWLDSSLLQSDMVGRVVAVVDPDGTIHQSGVDDE